ncbi:hypothetical protein RJ639_023579 [Escallonia herrerae]|uniref:Ty3 transposon capsid-like protein domain-containing protein n=1 Tax=Escallonia herrerae TaxID=1293975 RepID=A0AA88V0B6_9ASTE|nr:hypothetical protein RJ639_023579 [Escallonia herrerae]
MLEPRSYDGAREARQVDNFFWHLERYFEVLDIDDEEEKVQSPIMYLTNIAALWWRRRYTDRYDVKTWEKFKRELKRQFYPESVRNMAMINFRQLRQKGSIHEYVKEYLALMLEILEMSERQRLCFFTNELQQWVAIELQRREPHNLASAMVIVVRLEDFKQGKRSRSPRHERAKDGGDGRSKNGSSKATDDEGSRDEGRRRHHKGKKKHEGSRKQGPHYRRYCPHKGKNNKKRRGLPSGCWEESRSTCGYRGYPQLHESKGCRVAWAKIKDESWFTTVNAEERSTKGVVKNVDLRIDGWRGKADFNIIDMDELGVVLGMDFIKKSSTTLNPYCGVMMMAGKEGQPEWMISLVSKDGADACKGITVL